MDNSRIPSTDRTEDRREDALRFLFGRIDYERATAVPYRKREFKLDRMRELLDRLGSPQRDMPIVHIAGTKGKGSTAAMLATVLSAAGYRTGVFSSPHLERIEERMAVDGRQCRSEELVELVELIRPAAEAMDRLASDAGPDEIGPTYFELTTAMALVHFARCKVDAAVLEVGLGGRLDSTNVCRPCVAVITNISLDHTKQVGKTQALIAREKAGIIKPGVPVVSGVTQNRGSGSGDRGSGVSRVSQDEPREVVREVCRRLGCRLVELGVDFQFDYRPPRHLEREPNAGRLDFRNFASGESLRDLENLWEATPSATKSPIDLSRRQSRLLQCRIPERPRVNSYNDLSLGMPGRHQAANAAVALAVAAELQSQGWTIPESAIRTGIATASAPARVEVLGRRPAIVLDSAHNPASIAALLEVLDESFSVGRRLLLFATTQEKDIRGMLEWLTGRFDEVIFTRYTNNPRAVPPEELLAIAVELGWQEPIVCIDPTDAFEEVRRRAEPEDLICITGSFFIAAELRRMFAAI